MTSWRGRPAPIQSGFLIGQLARTTEFFSWKNCYVCISYTIFHHDETQFHSFVQLSNFLDPLPQFIMLLRIFNFHQSRCVCALCALMYEVKSMSKTSAIAASNKKYRLCRVYKVYRLYGLIRVYRLYRVYRVYRVYRLHPVYRVSCI